jgi:hypothetical protein
MEDHRPADQMQMAGLSGCHHGINTLRNVLNNRPSLCHQAQTLWGASPLRMLMLIIAVFDLDRPWTKCLKGHVGPSPVLKSCTKSKIKKALVIKKRNSFLGMKHKQKKWSRVLNKQPPPGGQGVVSPRGALPPAEVREHLLRTCTALWRGETQHHRVHRSVLWCI